MLNSIGRRATWSVLAILIACSLPLAARAGQLNIQLSDVDVVYNGGSPSVSGSGPGAIHDVVALVGGGVGGFGPFDPLLADQVQAAVFSVDMTTFPTLVYTATTNEMYGDLRINGVGPSITPNFFNMGIANNGGGFGFDWFTKIGTATGSFLQLGIDKIDLVLNQFGTINIAFSFSGVATVRGQNLPYGLAFDTNEPVIFTYSAPFPGVTGGPPPTGVMGKGAFIISGTLAQTIPEPATYVSLTAGLILLGLRLIRRPRNFALEVVRRRRN